MLTYLIGIVSFKIHTSINTGTVQKTLHMCTKMLHNNTHVCLYSY